MCHLGQLLTFSALSTELIASCCNLTSDKSAAAPCDGTPHPPRKILLMPSNSVKLLAQKRGCSRILEWRAAALQAQLWALPLLLASPPPCPYSCCLCRLTSCCQTLRLQTACCMLAHCSFLLR